MNLGEALVSTRYPTAVEVARRLAGAKPHAVFTALRVEDEARFWKAVRVFCEAFPWSGFAKHDVMRTHGELSWLAAHDARHFGRGEACAHFAYRDLAQLSWLTALDADLAYAFVRAIELGDPEATQLVIARLGGADVLGGSGSDGVGAARFYAMQTAHLGGDVRRELEWLERRIGHGNFVEIGAIALGARHRLRVGELPNCTGQSWASSARILSQVAYHVDPSFARSLVVRLTKNVWVNEAASAIAGLPWDARQVVASDAERVSVARAGALVVTTSEKLAGGRVTGKPRWSAGEHPDAVRAVKAYEKKLAEASAKLGAAPVAWSALTGLEGAEAQLVDAASGKRSRDVGLELCAADLDLAEARRADGWTALHYAARNDAEMVRRLLDAGVDPGVENADGLTPLRLCSGGGGHDERRRVELLVTAGARLGDGRLLESVAATGDAALVPWLRRAGATVTPRARQLATDGEHWAVLAALDAPS